MIVTSTWARIIVVVVALACLASCNMLAAFATSTESSGEYLEKVMLELRDINSSPSLAMPQRFTGSSSFFDVDDKHYLAGKRHSGDQQASSNQNHLAALQASILQAVANKIQPTTFDQIVSETAPNDNAYYQVQTAGVPLPQKLPQVPPITNSELNAVYNHAIEKGNAVSLNALANVLRHRHLSKVTTNQLETGSSNPMYGYYVYPLNSLMNDVRQGTHFIPAMPSEPENAAATGNSQKDLGNPLFMAISGFIGMAVLFMIGVLLFPRFTGFRSRFVDEDKLLHLTKTVGEAIDRHNCTGIGYPYVNLDERLRILCEPVKITRPSSVMLLTRKSALQQEAKRRKKIPKKCKSAPCKKNPERNGPT